MYLGFPSATGYAGGADASSLCRCRGWRAFILVVGVGLGCFRAGLRRRAKVIGPCLVIRLVFNLGFPSHVCSSEMQWAAGISGWNR